MRKTRRSAAMVAGAAIALLIGSVPASAATGPGGTVIACTVKFNDPHNSGHVNGTVNATVTTTCTSAVVSIKSWIRLEDLTNGRVNPSGGSNTYGTKSNMGNAALPCIQGVYQATGSVQVTFPQGFSPNWQAGEGASKAMGINCSGATFAAGGASAKASGSETGDTVLAEYTVTATRR